MGSLSNWVLPAVGYLVAIGFDVSGFENQTLAYVLWAIATCLLIVPAWPWIKRVGLLDPALGRAQGCLEIKFEDASCHEWVEKPHRLFPSDTEHHKRYWVLISNSGQQDIPNVRVELEKIESIANRPDEIEPLPERLNRPLIFRSNGKSYRRFSPGMTDRVDVISHSYTAMVNHDFSIEGAAYEFPHHGLAHLLYLKVTGSGISIPISVVFRTWVGQDGQIQMKEEATKVR